MKNKLVQIIRTKPFFLFLLPVFFVLHGVTENYDLIPFKDALILGLFYIGISILLSFFFWLFYKNFYKANLLAFSMICFQFFFGTVHDLFKKTFSDSLITRYSFILPATIILFILLIVFVHRSKKSFLRTTYYLNILLLILLLIDSVNLLVKATGKQHLSSCLLYTSRCV